MNEERLEQLIADLRSDAPSVRTAAWLQAGSIGAEAIPPLAALAVDRNEEAGRAASRAIWQIVRSVGAPGQEAEKPGVIQGLTALLTRDTAVSLRRDVIWMLSEISCETCVTDNLAALLEEPELREDARCALERIPGQASLDALQKALETVPEDFKMNIVQSLRSRGVEIAGYPCQKLVAAKSDS